MKISFDSLILPDGIEEKHWQDWRWQTRFALKNEKDFNRYIELSQEERLGFKNSEDVFQIKVTPYYAHLASHEKPGGPIRTILMPHSLETQMGAQQMLDPLGELKNSPTPRVIHRYPDRALFLVTDMCNVYCRYCTRKHFTGQERMFAKKDEYQAALDYFKKATGIREIILSGGDPLTLSDERLEKILFDLRQIDHIEIIRIGSRMPVVCPMRMTEDLAKILRRYKPVFLMTHFNHPKELTLEAAVGLEQMIDHGVPVFNQMVLLNGVNNHASIVQALSRRLLFLRVKPYYMFQCDPSEGTDHLRTSVEESLAIQNELWGNLSGLAMPTLSLDIPDGGGKTTLVPNFEVESNKTKRIYRGWDGVVAEYLAPDPKHHRLPSDCHEYLSEWSELKNGKLV